MTERRRSAGTDKHIKSFKPLAAAFITAVVANLVGVLLFFKPIAEGDTTLISIHPAAGLLVYVGLCLALLEWAYRHIGNIYKAAFIVAAPQFALIIDLTLSGKRGSLTAAAGTVLLVATWAATAFVYSLFANRET